MAFLEGLALVAVATVVTIWVNDTFPVGGDYITDEVAVGTDHHHH